MRSYVVFSTMGQDRPGLVKEIAEFFTARGINVERSRGCVLGNEFGMIILTSAKTEDIDGFISAMKAIAKEAEETPELLFEAPQVPKVRRLDETLAARKPHLAG